MTLAHGIDPGVTTWVYPAQWIRGGQTPRDTRSAPVSPGGWRCPRAVWLCCGCWHWPPRSAWPWPAAPWPIATHILISYGLLAVAGLAAIAAGAALTGSFGRMLARDLDALAAAAQQVAGLPADARPGERQAPRTDAATLAAEAATTEVAQAAAAIASLRRRAAAATRASPACATASGRSSSAWRSGTSRCCNGNCA